MPHKIFSFPILFILLTIPSSFSAILEYSFQDIEYNKNGVITNLSGSFSVDDSAPRVNYNQDVISSWNFVLTDSNDNTLVTFDSETAGHYSMWTPANSGHLFGNPTDNYFLVSTGPGNKNLWFKFSESLFTYSPTNVIETSVWNSNSAGTENYSTGPTPLVSGSASVPEPTSASLLGLGFGVMFLCRRKRK